MASELLTVAKLKSMTKQNVGSTLNDGGSLRGRVRLNRAGEITVQFEFRFRSGNKYRTAKVQQWPKHSLANIREICREMKAGLSKGIDPIEQRRTDKLENQLVQAQKAESDAKEIARLASEAASRRSFSDALEHWERLELSRRKDGGSESMRAIRKDITPTLGQVALVDVKRAMLVDLLDKVVERGSRVMANHLFADLKQFFNFAITRDWIEVHPLIGLTKEKIGGRQTERDRYLSEDEIIELHKSLMAAKLVKTTELSIWIMLSTCCRVGELAQARWEDLNMERGEWHIPAGNSKNAKEHTIYLSTFALEQFQLLLSVSSGSPWCLPSRNPTKHVGPKSIAKQIKDRTREEALPGRSKATGTLLLSGGAWTPHDLRRTGATMMGELGVMGEVIERCLNHVEMNKLKRTYQHQKLKEEQREAWKLLGERLMLLKSLQTATNVQIAHFG